MRKNRLSLERFARKFSGCLGAVVGTSEGPVAALHPHEIFPAASLIKVPILVALLADCDAGRARLDEMVVLKRGDKVGGSGILFELHDGIPLTLLDLATLMIVVSDNTATNLLIDWLEMGRIQSFIKEIGLSDTVLGRKLMVAPDDPPANFTTPMDMFVLFRDLANGRLLSPQNGSLALEILFRQQYNEKIPLLLPDKIRIAHKTGEIEGVRHDCGIIEESGGRWIACFLTKDGKDRLKADRLIAEMSLASRRFFSKKEVLT